MGHNTIIYEFGFDECGGELTVNGYGGCDGTITKGRGKYMAISDNIKNDKNRWLKTRRTRYTYIIRDIITILTNFGNFFNFFFLVIGV